MRLLVITVFLAVLSGCANQSRTNISNFPGADRYETASVIVVEEDLAKCLLIQELTAGTDPSGIFVAQASIFNVSKVNLTIEARAIFKDLTGKTVEASPWKQLTLTSRQALGYGAPSLRKDASRFLIVIRRPPAPRI